MFITDLAWKIEGVPKALLAPLVPWHSMLLDASEPCFAVLPKLDTQNPQTHVRMFADMALMVQHMQVAPGIAYAISRLDDQLNISKVVAVGSYLCPQTGIKLRVYFDDDEQPWPAHSGQPHFSKQLSFNVEASLV